jgi:hypothetical protein
MQLHARKKQKKMHPENFIQKPSWALRDEVSDELLVLLFRRALKTLCNDAVTRAARAPSSCLSDARTCRDQLSNASTGF